MRMMILALLLVLVATPAWTQSITASWTDNATNEEGFILERSGIVVQPDGTLRAEGFVEIARPPINSTSHVDSTISQGQFYCYRVAAYVTVVNADPPESKSTFSNIGCGMNITVTLTVQ